MLAEPLDLARARVLISNDDGVDAPGLKVLEDIVRPLAGEVWVAAPEAEQSGASHSLTLRRPLRIHGEGPRRYAIDGTPTDCVMLAVRHVMKDNPPDLVLSGVNKGGNLGDDATYSGTIAAAMEGALLGLPAIALSLVYDDPSAPRWDTVERHLPDVLKRLLAASWPGNVLVNVNFPDVPPDRVTGVEATRQGKRKIGEEIQPGVDPRGNPYYWIGAQRDEEPGQPHSDLEAVYRGAISVTPMSLDLTHDATLETLREALS